MSTFIEELADYLEDQSIGTVGTDIFFDHMPDPISKTDMVCVRDIGGPAPPGTLPQRSVLVQVMVRGDTYETARLLAAKVHNLFHGMVSVSLTYNVIQSSLGMGLPASLGPDENGRTLISGNYIFHTIANTASGESSTGFEGDKDPNLN
jgi:hypothetical protein